jgi:hypothetical protein
MFACGLALGVGLKKLFMYTSKLAVILQLDDLSTRVAKVVTVHDDLLTQ